MEVFESKLYLHPMQGQLRKKKIDIGFGLDGGPLTGRLTR